MPTIKEKLEAALAKRGYAHATHGSGKYAKWVKTGMRPLFVGPSGALRVGDNATNSSSLQHLPIYEVLVNEGAAILDVQSKTGQVDANKYF